MLTLADRFPDTLAPIPDDKLLFHSNFQIHNSVINPSIIAKQANYRQLFLELFVSGVVSRCNIITSEVLLSMILKENDLRITEEKEKGNLNDKIIFTCNESKKNRFYLLDDLQNRANEGRRKKEGVFTASQSPLYQQNWIECMIRRYSEVC